MSTAQILGSRVSVITRTNIRYEGIIENIDQTTRSITLQDVRIHGTENRQPPNGQLIPPSTNLYDRIQFNSGDLSHLEILEAVPQQQASAPVTAPVTTANPTPTNAAPNVAATQAVPSADLSATKPADPAAQQPSLAPNAQAPIPNYGGMPYGNPMAYGYNPMGYPSSMQEAMQNHYYQTYLQYIHRQKAAPGGYPYPPMNPFQNPAFENYMSMYQQSTGMNPAEYDTSATGESKPPTNIPGASPFTIPVPAPPPSLQPQELPSATAPVAQPFASPFGNPLASVDDGFSNLSLSETKPRVDEAAQQPTASAASIPQPTPVATTAAETNTPAPKPIVQSVIEPTPIPAPSNTIASNAGATAATAHSNEAPAKENQAQNEVQRPSNRSVFDPPADQQRGHSSFGGRSDRRRDGEHQHHSHNHHQGHYSHSHSHRGGSSNYRSSGFNPRSAAPREQTPLDEFDYVGSTASFDKEKFIEDIKAKDGDSSIPSSTASAPAVTYQKSSFFDNLSAPPARSDETRNRFDQRRVDVETFGQQNYSHRGGYRGGRGGYGGYNRGRGGYSHGGGRGSYQGSGSDGSGNTSQQQQPQQQQQQYGGSSGQRHYNQAPRGRGGDQSFRGGYRKFQAD